MTSGAAPYQGQSSEAPSCSSQDDHDQILVPATGSLSQRARRRAARAERKRLEKLIIDYSTSSYISTVSPLSSVSSASGIRSTASTDSHIQMMPIKRPPGAPQLEVIVSQSGGDSLAQDVIEESNIVGLLAIGKVFSAPVIFARWLFDQPRGCVLPGYVLITSWREARPSVLAIRSVVSGSDVDLRADHQRKELQSPIEVPGKSQVRSVIGACIIVAKGSETFVRADRFVREWSPLLPGVQMAVCSSAEECGRALQQLVGHPAPGEVLGHVVDVEVVGYSLPPERPLSPYLFSL